MTNLFKENQKYRKDDGGIFLVGGCWYLPKYNPKYESLRFCFSVYDIIDRDKRSMENMYMGMTVETVEKDRKLN